jgi:hypothetical protein
MNRTVVGQARPSTFLNALNGRSEGYQNGKALFLEAFAAGEANVKLVIETAPRGWPGQARP